MSTTPTLRDAAQAALEKMKDSFRASNERESMRCEHEAMELLSAALALNPDAALTQGAGAVEPVAWMVWWGIGHMRPSWPPYKTRAEAEDRASTIKSVTEVRPVYAAPPAQHLQQAVARAVEVCESRARMHSQNDDHSAANEAKKCAAAIRAKGTHD